MAAEIGSIAVRVGADITDLKSGMKEGSRTVGRFDQSATKKLRNTANQLAKVGAAAVAAGAALVAGLYVKGSQAIDAQAKLARQLGTTTAAVQGLSRSAELGGVAQGKMESALRSHTKRLGDAVNGTGEASKAYKQLGLDARELSKIPLDERLAVIADAVNGLNTAAEKSSALDKLMSGGRRMINMFEGGGDSIRAARKDVEDFGLAVSDVDAAKVEAANDAMTAMGVTMKSVANTIAIELSPYVQAVGDQFGKSARESGGFKDEIVSLVNSALKGFGKVGNVLQGLRVTFKGLELVAVGFGAAIVSAAQLAMEGITWLNDEVNSAVNAIIRQLNKVKGVDIGEVGMFANSPFMEGLREMGDFTRNKVAEVRGELHDMAMQELPSDKIEKFLGDVAKRSQEVAEEVVAARNQMVTMPENEMGGGDDAEKKKQEAALEAIRNRYVTEQELLREHREMMAVIGEEYDAAKFETEAEWRDVREQAEKDHMDKLAAIRERGMNRIDKFQAMSMQSQLKTVTSALVNMTAGVASENKKMFELNKKAGIANAIISAYQGISTTLGAYPFPLSAAMAAAQGAAAFAQVNAIRSQSFGGGGGAAPSLAGGTPATPTTDVQGGAPPQQQQTMRVEGLDRNSLFGGDAVQTIAQNLMDFQKDGGQVVFAG